MKAQKKPIVIDYLPYTGGINEVNNWVRDLGDNFHDWFIPDYQNERIYVKTLEGTSYEVTTNDMIIRGVQGEYYPCKKDIFYETYDLIN